MTRCIRLRNQRLALLFGLTLTSSIATAQVNPGETKTNEPPPGAVIIRVPEPDHDREGRAGSGAADPSILEPRIQAFGVGGPRSGMGRLLVVWSIPGEDHPKADTLPGVPGVVYTIQLHVDVVDSLGTVLRSLDSLKRYRKDTPLVARELLSGLLTIDMPVGTYRAEVSVAEGGGRRKAIRVIPGLPVPELSDSLEMSDLVLGLDGQALSWNRSGTHFPLNPRNAWTTAESMEIAFELAGVTAGADYGVRLSLREPEADRTAPPKVTVAFERRAGGGVELVRQTLGLGRLRPGRYLLTVLVSVGDRTLQRERRITIVRD